MREGPRFAPEALPVKAFADVPETGYFSTTIFLFDTKEPAFIWLQ